jgi:hypothetical protein
MEDDGKTQVAAAKLVVEIHGALAPQQIEVTHEVGENLRALTGEELEQRFKETVLLAAKLLGKDGNDSAEILDLIGSPAGDSFKLERPQERNSAPKGKRGRFLLGDPPDENDGRTGA